MKRMLRCLELCAVVCLASVTITPVVAQTMTTDSYAAMLTYLDNSTIGGNALQGTQGISSVNTAAGDANLQGNLHALSALDQEWSGNKVANGPSDECCFCQQATISAANLSGDVLSGASSNLRLNQASGTGNL